MVAQLSRDRHIQFRLGLAVWSYRGWLGDFYPLGCGAGEFLRCYGERLSVVEGNTTFYAVPSGETIARWVAQTPVSFRFCLKFPQRVSHQGLLFPQIELARSFLALVQGLGDRLGCVFLQLPPHYAPANFEDLQQFFNALAAIPVKLGLEVRHLQWFEPQMRSELNAFLTQQNIAQVLLDTRPVYDCEDDPQRESRRKKPQLPLLPVVTGDLAIIRFISHPVLLNNQSYLQQWVTQIEQWLQQDKESYFFVHCPIEDHSPAIARHFQAMLEATGLPIPAIGWDQLPPEPQQLSLF